MGLLEMWTEYCHKGHVEWRQNSLQVKSCLKCTPLKYKQKFYINFTGHMVDLVDIFFTKDPTLLSGILLTVWYNLNAHFMHCKYLYRFFISYYILLFDWLIVKGLYNLLFKSKSTMFFLVKWCIRKVSSLTGWCKR